MHYIMNPSTVSANHMNSLQNQIKLVRSDHSKDILNPKTYYES
jgi:hypothetical protein